VRPAAAALLAAAAVVPLSVAAARRPAPAAPAASCGCTVDEPQAPVATATEPGEKVIIVQGRREPGEASVSTAAMKYLPFDVPAGVTKITIHKEFDHGPDPYQKNTVDFGLFDPRGGADAKAAGFRGWQGGAPGDFVVAGTAAECSPHAVPGMLPAGRWHIAQYLLRSSPAGLGYKYTVTLSFAGATPKRAPDMPRYEPAGLKTAPGWYAGNLHTHTLHSDGGRTLADMVTRCRAAGFDFVASTEHNSTTAHYRFPEAAAATQGVLLLYGDELTTPGGHANIIGQRPGYWFDFRMDPGDGRLPRVIDEAHGQGAVFVVNHPFAICTSCPWRFREGEWAKADAIEVWNGRWTAEDRQAVDLWDGLLKKGRRVWAYGGTDYHRGEDALTPASFVYSGKGLARAAVLDGLRRGRVLLSESPAGPRVWVAPTGGADALPGGAVKAKDGDPVAVRVAGGRGMRVRLVWSTGETTLPVGDSDDVTLAASVPPGATYLRAELVKNEAGDLAALTNPVFIERR